MATCKLTKNGELTQEAIRRDALRALDAISADLVARGYGPLNDDQRACVFDDARAEEARAMIDHLIARCDVRGWDAEKLLQWIDRADYCERATDVVMFNEYPDIEFPAELRAAGFIDDSWHNDACAAACKPIADGMVTRVWVDHDDATQREMRGSKYLAEIINDGTGDTERVIGHFEGIDALMSALRADRIL